MTEAQEADGALLVEIAQLHMAPDRPGKDAELNTLVATADDNDYLNAAVFGRLCLCLRALHEHDVPTGGSLFAWCEAQWTARGSELVEITVELMLTLYGLLVINVRENPEVPFSQVDDVVDALVRRHRQYGANMRNPYMQEHLSARARDDDAAAEESYRRWQAQPVPEDSEPIDSIAMSWLSATGRWDAVVDRYRAALAGVHDYPWSAEYLHAGALEALLRLGREDDAREAHRLGLAAVDRDDPGLDAIGQHLDYCAATGRLDDGLAVLTEYLPWRSTIALPGLRVDFCQGAVVLLRRLQEAGRGQDVVTDGRTVDDLESDLRAEAIGYAETVDRVNAGDVGTRRLRRFWTARGVTP